MLFSGDNAYGHNQKERGKEQKLEEEIEMHVINVSITCGKTID